MRTISGVHHKSEQANTGCTAELEPLYFFVRYYHVLIGRMIKILLQLHGQERVGDTLLVKKLVSLQAKLKQRGIDPETDDNWFREFTKSLVPEYVIDDARAVKAAQIFAVVMKEDELPASESTPLTPSSLYFVY